jgi:hypothetical protein
MSNHYTSIIHFPTECVERRNEHHLLHCETGPAVEYWDGTVEYWLGGVQFDTVEHYEENLDDWAAKTQVTYSLVSEVEEAEELERADVPPFKVSDVDLGWLSDIDPKLVQYFHAVDDDGYVHMSRVWVCRRAGEWQIGICCPEGRLFIRYDSQEYVDFLFDSE